MAGRIANQLQLANVRGNAAPAPTGAAQKALSASLFQDVDNAKEQLQYLELLEKKSRIRGADARALGPDAPVLKAICGTRSPEEAMMLKILARLSKIDERDPRLLQLRSVYGSNLSKMQLARELATKLIAKRHAEAALFSVLQMRDQDFENESRRLYNAAMDASEMNNAVNPEVAGDDPAMIFGYGPAGRALGAGFNANRLAGRALRQAHIDDDGNPRNVI
jgi:hypothetical protein